MGAGVATSPHSSSEGTAGAVPSLETGSGRGFSAPVGSVALPRCPKASQFPLCGPFHPKVPGLRRVSFARGLRSRVGLPLESGFGSFRLSPSRASRFFLRLSCRPLCRCIRSCELQAASPRWQWLAALRSVSGSPLFRPHKQADRWHPSRASGFARWISRITGIRSAAATKPSAIKLLQPGNRWRGPIAPPPFVRKKLWRSLTFLLRMAPRSRGNEEHFWGTNRCLIRAL